jgi:glycosyltransferase involved in cell wall biosynthesis
MDSNGLWVVGACFNEETVIPRFIERVIALPDVDCLLLIDDGSSDDTVAVIRQWQAQHPEAGVVLIEFTRNFGKEAASKAIGLARLREIHWFKSRRIPA